MNHWSDNLPSNACGSAIIWARTQPTLDDAWRNCQRGDWMLWLLARHGADRRLLVRAAALCAEPAAALADEYTEAVCLSVIQTCVAWSEGGATDEELDVATAARAAAWVAVWASSSASSAASSSAASAASSAASSAAAEAAAWAAAEARARAARSESLAHSADIVRGLFPRAPRLAT